MTGISFEVVNELIRLDGETGRLYWRERSRKWFEAGNVWRRWNTRYANKEAFTTSTKEGYRQGRIFDRAYYAHRVVWLLTTGEWPLEQIDHINGVRDDNKPSNLRAVSNAENTRNARKPKDNSSGVIGVYWHKQRQKWHARISVVGEIRNLGLFSHLDDAVACRKAAEMEFGYHENHGRAA